MRLLCIPFSMAAKCVLAGPGFTAGGVVKGSAAAAWQACIGAEVATGSDCNLGAVLVVPDPISLLAGA